MLERAVRLDPEFAVAHAMLSEAHSRMYHHRYDFTPERLEMARASAGRAMELQPGLPEAHLAFGFYYYWGFRDYDRALEHFEITAERLPNDPDLLMGAFAVLRRQGRWDQALEALERWQRVDPQGYIAAITSSITNRVVRDFEMAEQENRRAISIAPDLPDAYCEGAWNYLLWDGTTNRASQLLASAPSLDSPESDYTTLSEMGDWQRAHAARSSAIEFIEVEIHTRPHDYRIYSALGHAYALLGRSEEAVRAGQRAVELMGTSRDAFDGPTQEIELAKIYTRVGQSDMALDLIEKLLSIPCDFSVGLLRLDPVWDPLRDHPRFQALLEEYDTE
jgi:serine/threonine-protein kinase